ncbi:MAG: hypothetical protein HeimC3_30080 [Candidatus Heimdallarchaeota archaeon LC_3]|nr:MAG: hypothetical protein HeimC3_30080 [Candidatus Heimdallarchaeota archaeon LC_3]
MGIILPKFTSFQEKSAKMTLSMKVVRLILLILTAFIAIEKVTYTTSGLEAVLTFTPLSATAEVIIGNSGSLPSSINSSALTILFILPVLFIGLSFVFLFKDKTKVSALFHVIGLGFLFIYLVNFFTLNSYDGRVLSGITLNIAYDIGYYLL